MTTEEKFNAAVNVIRNLPKNGSYQPSNDLMLRFYAYFKQATQGPCTGPRPAFYELVGRAKYDAWKKLDNMSKTEAMGKYVAELHTIVETMSYSDNVANFLEAPTTELDSIDMNDLELVAGDVMERIRSQPNSPLASREASPIRMRSSDQFYNGPVKSQPDDSDHSDEEYTDTLEFPDSKRTISNGSCAAQSSLKSSSKEHISRGRTKHTTHIDNSSELSTAIKTMRRDIEKLTMKINTIDKNSELIMRRNNHLLSGVPLKLFAVMLAWPILANFVMNRYFYNRK